MYESKSIVLYWAIAFCFQEGCVWLPRNSIGGEDVLFQETLLDELLQVSSEGPTMDRLVPFAVVIGAILLRSGQ